MHKLMILFGLLFVVLCSSNVSSARSNKRAQLLKRLLKSNQKRSEVPAVCCIPPFTAVLENMERKKMNSRVEKVGDAPIITWDPPIEESIVHASDGERGLKIEKTRYGISTYLNVLDEQLEEDCQYCYLGKTYAIDPAEKCYKWYSPWSYKEYRAGACPLELENAQVTDEDASTGITKLSGRSRTRGVSYSAEVKLLADGCIPVSIVYSPQYSDGYAPNTTVTAYETSTFKPAAFDDSFGSLLSLELTQCPPSAS